MVSARRFVAHCPPCGPASLETGSNLLLVEHWVMPRRCTDSGWRTPALSWGRRLGRLLAREAYALRLLDAERRVEPTQELVLDLDASSSPPKPSARAPERELFDWADIVVAHWDAGVLELMERCRHFGLTRHWVIIVPEDMLRSPEVRAVRDEGHIVLSDRLTAGELRRRVASLVRRDSGTFALSVPSEQAAVAG